MARLSRRSLAPGVRGQLDHCAVGGSPHPLRRFAAAPRLVQGVSVLAGLLMLFGGGLLIGLYYAYANDERRFHLD